MTACGGGGDGNPRPVEQPGTLQFSSAVTVDENAGTAQLTITRTLGSAGAVSVTVASADGDARAGHDFTALNTTVNFADGDVTAKTVTVSILDDSLVEADEAFVVTMVNPTGGVQLGSHSAVVTIRDNEPRPVEPPAAPTVAVSAAIKQLTFTWASVPGATSYRLLRNPDGASGFVPVGSEYPNDTLSASVEVAVHRHDWVNALYRVEACNLLGCSGSNSVSAVDAMAGAIGYFKASNTDAADQFGNSVALSADGRTLAVGAPLEASAATGVDGDQGSNTAFASGAVYIFTHDGTRWSQQAYVKASNANATHAFDLFGYSIALSADGRTLAVGAALEDSGATGVGGDQENDNARDSGAVYVFTRGETQWSQQAYVKASNTGADDNFGIALALSADGSTLAVGAWNEGSSGVGVGGEDNNEAPGAGAAYVFTRDGTQWLQQAYVKASNTHSNDGFGFSLALSADGGTLAVGASFGDPENDNSADSGAVYVFTRAGTQWAQQAQVMASNPDAGDRFGYSLALSADGSTLAVGAQTEDGDATGVGGQDDDDAVDSGAVYVFTRAETRWSQQAYIKASNTGAGDDFGFSLALSADGSTLAVGATNEDSNAIGVGADQGNDAAADAGAVYVFTREAAQWSQRSYVKASNTGADDQFGFSLTMSADGSTLAVGVPNEDSTSTGVPGAERHNDAAEDAGAVYLF